MTNSMSTNDPDDIRRNIDATRRDLSHDVQALNDKVSPSQIMHRRTDAARSAVAGVKDKIMGTASDGASHASMAGGTMSSAASSVGDTMSSAASSVGDTVSGAPQAIQARAQGNPLAAGLIAFGVGWLASSLVPASAPEQRLAQEAKDHAGPVMDRLAEGGKELQENLAAPARDALDAVKSSAADAASTVADQGKSAGQDVTQQAKDSKDSVQSAG